MLFSLYIVSLFSSKLLPVVSGSNLSFPNKSSISIPTFLGIASNAIDAINISLNNIIGTTFPFATYVSKTFPKINPAITPRPSKFIK